MNFDIDKLYHSGDIVIYNGVYYICNFDCKGVRPVDTSNYWNEYKLNYFEEKAVSGGGGGVFYVDQPTNYNDVYSDEIFNGLKSALENGMCIALVSHNQYASGKFDTKINKATYISYRDIDDEITIGYLEYFDGEVFFNTYDFKPESGEPA